MSLILKNNASSRLSGSITATQTQIAVELPSRFPLLDPGDWFPVTVVSTEGREVMKVVGQSSGTFTVDRAQEGTVARSFEAGDIVEIRLTTGVLNEISGLGQTGIDLANGAQDAADSAMSAAMSAQTSAGAAQISADQAQSTADTALVTANTATDDASAAQASADTAAQYASSAQSAADNAQSTGDTAVTDASAAQSTADDVQASALKKDQNLADVDDASISRSSLGIGSMATRDVTVSNNPPSGGADGDVWLQVEEVP